MPKVVLTNTCGPYEINTDWSQSFVESMAALAASRGTLMTYDEKQAIFLTLKTVEGSGDSNINIYVADGTTSIQSSAFIGKQITGMFGDSFVKMSGFTSPDANGSFSFTDDTVLYAGIYKIYYA